MLGRSLLARDTKPAYEFKSFRFKASNVGEDGTFEGYGSIFGTVDTYGDIVMPGAFKASLADHILAETRPKGLWQHDPNHPILSWVGISEDSKGLRCKGRLILEVEKARETYALMKAGEIDALSIGYETEDEEFISSGDLETKLGIVADGPPGYDNRYRLLHKCSLWEVSAVTFPACKPARIDQVKHHTMPPAGLDRFKSAMDRRSRLLADFAF